MQKTNIHYIVIFNCIYVAVDGAGEFGRHPFVHKIQALRVRDLKFKFIEQLDQVERNQQQHGEPNNGNDRREQLMQELSDDEDQAANNQQEPPEENSSVGQNPPPPGQNPPPLFFVDEDRIPPSISCK